MGILVGMGILGGNGNIGQEKWEYWTGGMGILDGKFGTRLN
jgi:hypothetical protein